ncbi:hypothetical protein ACFL2O_06995, partial [Thermodesulfobacteriota bacterium]
LLFMEFLISGGKTIKGGIKMGKKENFVKEGWVSVSGNLEKTNTKTGKVESFGRAERLVSPDGRTVYRPGTGVLTSFSDDESFTIKP